MAGVNMGDITRNTLSQDSTCVISLQQCKIQNHANSSCSNI